MVTWQIIWLVGSLMGAGLMCFFNAWTKGDAIGGFFLGAFVIGIFGGIIMLGAWAEDGSLTQDNVDSGQCTSWETEEIIASVERLSEESGSFILGSGSFSQTMYYYGYVEKTDGWFLEKYRQSKSYIVERDTPPKVVSTHWRCDKPFISWLMSKKWFSNYYNRKHVIHVPLDSIIREYRP